MSLIFQGLDAEDYDRTYKDATLIRRTLLYFRPQLRRMLLVVVVVVLASVIEIIIPVMISRGIDLLNGHLAIQIVLAFVTAVTILSVFGWFFNFVRQFYTAQAVANVVLKLREDAFTRVMNSDLSFFDRHPAGTIVSRITSDSEDFATVITLCIDLVSQILLVVIVSVVLLRIEPLLALMTLAMGPLIILAVFSYRRLARHTTQQAQRIIAQVNAQTQETLSGITVAKSFRQEKTTYEKFQQTNMLAYRIGVRQGIVFNLVFPTLEVFFAIGTAVIVYFGGVYVLHKTISIGNWYLFVQSLSIFYVPLTSIAAFWSQFQRGLAASERIFALIDTESSVVQSGHDLIEGVKGEIELKHIHFGYAKQENVLSDFSLSLPAGMKLAIVGQTGAGKSSVIRLIARFYEFQSGQLLIDNRDIRTFDLTAYRKQIGFVSQVPFLFSGTVADNIRYGKPGACNEAVEAAAHSLNGGDWLLDLAQGLATDVGERGTRLSQGQRQLVVLARILLQDPAVFILDEATASIDPFTEEQIQEALDRVMQHRTCIIIAHRLSTIVAADRIIVMQAGKIVEDGDHQELLRQKGFYAELYATYFRHQSIDYIEQIGQY